MQDCPECGGSARDVHSFCPECGQALSSGSASRLRGGGSSSDDSDESSAEGEGIERRQLLMYGGAAVGAAAVGGGGGFLLLSGGGGSGDGPAGTTRSFLQALDEGETEEAQRLVHEDSNLNNNLEMLVNLYEQADVTVNSVEVLSRSDSSATVEANVTIATGGSSESSAADIELRSVDGEWRVFSFVSNN